MVRLVAYLRHGFTEIYKTSLDARFRDDQREEGRSLDKRHRVSIVEKTIYKPWLLSENPFLLPSQAEALVQHHAS